MNEDMKKYCGGHYVKKTIAILAVALSIFVLTETIAVVKGLKYIGGTNEPANIVVSGTGEIDAVPDSAAFSFTITEEASSVSDAQSAAATKANAILAYLEKNGVDAKDVQTTDYSISPRYEYPNATSYQSGTRVLAGYDVSESVSVQVKDISSAGTLLSGVGEFGAENVSDLSFTESNHDDLVKQAEAKAIADAEANASRIAKDLGVTLGRITAYSNQSSVPVPVFYAQSMAVGASNTSSVPVIASGQNKITANVSITYEIQ